jgi:hypothetical protein
MNSAQAGAPEPRQPANAASERYRSFPDLPRFALGDNLELVYSPLTRGAQTLPAIVVQFLLGCRTFATLEDHAARLCREFGFGCEQEGPIRQHLAGLAQAGLLLSEADLSDHCRRHFDPGETTPRIAAVGIPTRDRTDALHRCLASHLESARRAGRTTDFVIVDDSEKPQTRQANRHLLEALKARHAGELAYAGPEEKEHFAAALVRQTGSPPEAVAFALGNPESCPIATGANRNALLLHTVGDLLLQVDDDTACQLAPAPGSHPGLAFSSQYDPTEFWFLPEGEPTLPGSPLASGDLLAVHEQLLGKSPGACVAGWPGNADPDLEQTGAGFFRRLQAPGPRVVVTAAGVAGDSGMGSSVFFLLLDGNSRARLLRSERDYRSALACHKILRAAPRATVCDGGFCMAPNLGLDNRQLLPPFMPVQRNQDGVFGALVRCCQGGGYFGYLPWTVLHQPPAPRRFTPDDLWTSIGSVQSGQVLQTILRSFGPGQQKGDTAKNLREVGRALTEWGTAPAADFEEWVRLHLWSQLSRQIAQVEDLLRRFREQPDYWANDVRQFLAVLRQALPERDYALPRDLARLLGGDEGRALLQRLVRRFGQLLGVWPDLVAAAKELRARGFRLAQPV